MRSRSSLVTPSRKPVSVSCLRTHSSNVWAEQPIFGAMDSIVDYSEGYSLRCSCTRRTARALTSGEYLFDLFMAPSSQILEPPQNPRRFSRLLYYSRTETSVRLKKTLSNNLKRLTYAILIRKMRVSEVIYIHNKQRTKMCIFKIYTSRVIFSALIRHLFYVRLNTFQRDKNQENI
jgi:hypothetical protein